jgi:anti-sigma factor RsiW
MNCVLNQTEQEELLLGYTTVNPAVKLDLDTARTYERHLQSCPQCRELVELHKLLDNTLDAWQAPEPSPNFDSKLFAKIREEQNHAAPWWQAIFGWKILVPAALAATLLIAFFVRSPEPATIADTIQADQIEKAERALEDFEALQAISTPDPTQTDKEVL